MDLTLWVAGYLLVGALCTLVFMSACVVCSRAEEAEVYVNGPYFLGMMDAAGRQPRRRKLLRRHRDNLG